MKIRYQKRQGIPKLESGNKSSIKYVGYKDGFYYKETTKMWCWKQESKEIVPSLFTRVPVKTATEPDESE